VKKELHNLWVSNTGEGGEKLSLTTISNVNEMIEFQSQENGQVIALVCEHHKVTYHELNQNANKIAQWMLGKGAQKGDRALIWGANKHQMVEFFLACSKIGVIAVPINLRLKESEVNYIIDEIKPAFIYRDDGVKPEWKINHDLRGELSLTIEQGTDHYDDIIKSQPGPLKAPMISHSDPFFIIYTAAVDGNPRGAVLTHENIISCNEQTKELLQLTRNDTCGIFTPLYHIAGTSLLFSGLHYGLTNIILPVFTPSDAATKIKKNQISIFCSFSPMMQMILDAAHNENIELQPYIRGIFGLDTPEMIQKLLDLNIDFFGMYAQSEVTGIIASEKYVNPHKQNGLIGFPGLHSKIKLLNDTGSEVKTGEIGEICVEGKTVFSHYWNMPIETKWVFRGGHLHTGDLAERDQEGRLWFRGRKTEKELIKTGGENVYPLEVEQAIQLHQAVKSVVVFGVKDDKWLEAVKAVIELEENEITTEMEIKAFCKERMASYKVPKFVNFVKELPKNNGEIDREFIKKVYR
jgi:acyl-CoA synthetase (AMP-forming)/AMP-acid ligase II